jgi:hypothetical protein
MPRTIAIVCRTLSLLAFVAPPLLAAVAEVAPENAPLSRDAEFRAALAAGPPSLTAGAGVYVLTANGYELARPSTNGFHCLVERSFPGSFEPQCFDEEGSRTLLQATLLTAKLRGQGRQEPEVRAAVAAAWADGTLRAPSRPGINYMLHPDNRVPIDPEGKLVVPYGPHLMFYVPYLTNADLGSDGSPAAPTFVINEGQPGAYAIVPVATGGGHGEPGEH